MALPRITFVAALLLVMTGACTSLRRVQPVEYFQKNSPDVVWVTYPDNTVVPVAEPEVTGDTLKGRWQGSQRRVAIPLDGVKSVGARLPDKTKTAVFVTGLIAVWASTVYVLWVSKAGPNPDGVRCGVDQRGLPIQYC